MAELEAIHRRKTGALLRRLAADGRRSIAGRPSRDREALDRYGRAVGLAFQIVDDLLDVQGDEAKLGKRVARIPSWANGPTPGSWASTAAAAGPGSWPTRPWRRSRRSGPRGDRLRALALALLERDR